MNQDNSDDIDTDDDGGEDLKQHLLELNATVQQLLTLCAQNEVPVPDELKARLRQSVQSVQMVSLRHHRAHDRDDRGTHTDLLVEKQHERRSSVECIASVEFLHEFLKKVKADPPDFDLRIRNGSYTVTKMVEDDDHHQTDQDRDNAKSSRRSAKQKIKTVQTESPVYKLVASVLRCMRGEFRRKTEKIVIMDQVNIALEPGKMYLVLGSPGSGKSTLLKMIANTLHQDRNHVTEGEVSVAGVTPQSKCGKNATPTHWSNLVAYIDQIDRLHPYLTVQETCEFAWMCRAGGTHRKSFFGHGADVDEVVAEMDRDRTLLHRVLDALGLTRVKDTYVGDSSSVRGVSGGERKRVTVAEMLLVGSPVICADEISTGLDAATTYDITRTFSAATSITQSIKVVSLLQPPPETVANFDDLILLAEGKIIYFGPVEDVVNYFESLGYEIPERMDVADWLQSLPTKDGAAFLRSAHELENDGDGKTHLTPEQFREKFHESDMGKALMERVHAPFTANGVDMIRDMAAKRFKNSALRSLRLVVQRELLLWWRDKYAIRAKIIQDLMIGVIVGTM